MLEIGFDGNIKDNNGATVLYYGTIPRFDHFYLLFLFLIATHKSHLDIAKYFLEKGFDGNIKDNDGAIALHKG